MIDEVAPAREPLAEEPIPARVVRGGARRPRRMRRARPTVRSGSLAVVLAAAILTGLALAFQGFARWAGEHPGWAVLLGLAAVPVLYALLRGMPHARDLRRAARAGMAEAEADALAATRTAPPVPVDEPADPPTRTQQPPFLADAFPPGPEEPTLAAPFHDGRTTPLPEPEAPAPYATEPYAPDWEPQLEPELELEPEPEPEAEAVALTAAELDGVDLATLDFAALDPDTFEEAVAALCRRDGCADAETVGGAGDLGADVLATAPDGRRVVIQCKRYGPENKVGSQDLQRFGGTCWSVHGAQLAVLVTTSEFTVPAEEYAESCGIRCVDGTELTAWAEGTGPAPWGPGATLG
ncbi:restriction endonuclease [Streptomyces albidoflavus]|uniref:restriction endonuclease n=1 Tax=Streptomyces albidoflavus TaxID=1886 RepID=UPI00101E4861|nr:restriction endonuclease [Streptomyces albidoflavus]RZD81591.1 restriction endonuclease [Streptomyces albidoflavus]RZD99115.1 restriction endonuclease [Streptomyces albidoflavus]